MYSIAQGLPMLSCASMWELHVAILGLLQVVAPCLQDPLELLLQNKLFLNHTVNYMGKRHTPCFVYPIVWYACFE